MKRCPTLLLSALLTAVLLVPGAPVQAQTTLSLTGGVNLTSLDTDSDGALAPDFESLTGMSVGLAATIPVTDRFGFQLGGRYAQKGGRLDVLGMMEMMGETFGGFEEMPPGTSINVNFEMDYIELTALARVEFPLSGDRVSGLLLAGPALGLRSSCDGVVSISDPAGPGLNQGVDCDESGLDFRTIDVGLAGGAGIDIGLTDSIDARLGVLYTLGLSNVLSDLSEDDGGLKHRALTIQTGLAFPIG